jgi:hypothetical protein
MKKLIVVSMIMALTLLVWGSFATTYAQESATEDKPTFYRLVPGTYVNGWPRFTVTYPKDWVEMGTMFRAGEVFKVSAPRSVPDRPPPILAVIVFYNPQPLETFGNNIAGVLKNIATDVAIVSDKPSQLRDGTPAREVELQLVVNGLPACLLYLATRKGDMCVGTVVGSGGKIGKDLKAILYSVEFQPGKDEPVKLPPDIQEFLDKFSSANVAHDITQLMAHYSERYLNSGTRKGEMERFHRQIIGPVTSFEVGITDFVPAGDRAYLTGFVRGYWGKSILLETSIIKENGEWKWYGNQRDVAR